MKFEIPKKTAMYEHHTLFSFCINSDITIIKKIYILYLQNYEEIKSLEGHAYIESKREREKGE